MPLESLVKNLKLKYRKKKILITGVSGFKGSWLSLILANFFNSEVIGVDRIHVNKNRAHYELIKNSKNIKFIKLDLKNFNQVKKIFESYSFDYIFHFAADALVSECFKKPKESWSNNLLGSLNLLESIRIFSTKSVLNISTTDKVYYNENIDKKFIENDKIWGLETYGASKVATELLIDNYFSSYLKEKKIHINIFRGGNVIGGGDFSKDRIFPDIFKSLNQSKLLLVRNQNSIRPWQHVLDCLFSYLIISCNNDKKTYYRKYNIGPQLGKNLRVIDILKIAKIYFPNLKFKTSSSSVFKESNVLKLNSHKFFKEFNYIYRYDQKKSVMKTLDWYKKYLNNKEVDTLNQIYNYISNA